MHPGFRNALALGRDAETCKDIAAFWRRTGFWVPPAVAKTIRILAAIAALVLLQLAWDHLVAPTKPAESILPVTDKLRWLGDVEAENEKAAIADGAREFERDPNKLMAVRRAG